MNQIPEGFEGFLESDNVLFAIVSFAPYKAKRTFGNQLDFEPADIVEQYFEDLSTLNDALTGRILPRMVQQGSISAAICKPAENVIVGLVYRDPSDAVQRYHHSKRLNDKLLSLWSEMQNKTAD